MQSVVSFVVSVLLGRIDFSRCRLFLSMLYVAWPSVCRSVCLSVTTVSCAQTAERIEMKFGMGTPGDPSNIVLKFGRGRPNIRGTCPRRGSVPFGLEIFQSSVGSAW